MSSVRPLFASCLALLWLAGPLASELHFLVVEHSVCPEHGELTEQAGHKSEGFRVSEEDAHEHSAGPTLASASAHDDGHDHGCGFLLPTSPNVGSELALLVRPYALDFAPPLLREVDAPRAPPLSFAPKTSPPRS